VNALLGPNRCGDRRSRAAPARLGDLVGTDRAHDKLRAKARWRTPAWIEFPAVTADVGEQRGAVGAGRLLKNAPSVSVLRAPRLAGH
jgi:hypothetical protein